MVVSKKQPRDAKHCSNKTLSATLVPRQALRLMIVLSAGLFVIVGCEPYDDHKDDKLSADSEHRTANAQTKTEIEDKIVNSYARIASEQPHLCPKLIQKKVDTTVIKRKAEIMVNNSCDYFLYPKVGERIAVKVNNDQLEALLITPEIYNFANGEYQVDSYDKHVIRLAYNGATYKPENFSYDVEVTVAE